jgi:hypothetical protein
MSRIDEIKEQLEWKRQHAERFKIGALMTACDEINYLLSCIEGRGVEDGDLVSRKAAMAAMCSRCANPDRYGPAVPIEGSRRLFHFQIADNWNAGQCNAQAIKQLPTTALTEQD